MLRLAWNVVAPCCAADNDAGLVDVVSADSRLLVHERCSWTGRWSFFPTGRLA
ncbi:hypothetical protein EXIGLDRAFT_725125 [Exidia glandulosa HHB12029]|uniref:Uncharacterized protein n=1 Tax=Exidia glandulosa HHB12029 TaxID=1314781 RepID=A0A165E5S7_EXIGL|nr:hypothetical protein EXIGLDRAFT_725125 [Exidia glandulosa HHB12029]